MISKTQVLAVLKSTPVLVGATAVLSAMVGSRFGYKLACHRMDAHYTEIAQKEIEQSKKYYKQLVAPQYSTPKEALQALVPEAESDLAKLAVKALREYKGEAEPEPEAKQVQVVTNVFIPSKGVQTDEWDYAVELENRSSDTPYIIHYDEFHQNEPTNAQVNLTYFVQDDVLVDEKDEPIPVAESTVGDEALSKFGYGSKDNRVVYVRNERLAMDFEILRTEGSYAKDILGFIQHDHRPKNRRYRGDDE